LTLPPARGSVSAGGDQALLPGDGPMAGEGSRKARWLLAAALAAGLLARLLPAVRAPLIYDEYQWTARADRVSLSPLNLPLHGDQHPPGEVYWSALGAALLGRNLLGYRLASVLLGTLTILVGYRLGRFYFGEAAGLLAAWLLAADEYLINVSSLATEKTYLAFALLALLAFERALRRRTTAGFVLAGLTFGVGLVTKQVLVFWVPLFAARLLARDTRSLWKTRGPWLGALVCLAVVTPDLYWNFVSPGPSEALGAQGIPWQASRLGPGGWSWAPTALYLRLLVSDRGLAVISEYASMTVIPGAILLACAVASLFVLRSLPARFLQALGWGPFLFVSLTARNVGEFFWWADLSVCPFVLLTAGLVQWLPRARTPVALALAGVFLVHAAPVVTETRNCHPPVLPNAPSAEPLAGPLDPCASTQKMLIVRNRRRDHEALTRVGRWCLPARAVYREWLRDYRDFLDRVQRGAWKPKDPDEMGWPLPRNVDPPVERRWVDAELARLACR
jgi:Dolichyl-phosphate-mannose-protein mannosyltransferase